MRYKQENVIEDISFQTLLKNGFKILLAKKFVPSLVIQEEWM
jgi:hypothetical protein